MCTQSLSLRGEIGHYLLDRLPLFSLAVNVEPEASVDLQQAHPAVLVQDGGWELGAHVAPGLQQGDALLMYVPLQLVQVLLEGPPLQGVGVGMVGELVTLGTARFVCDSDVHTRIRTQCH